MKYLKMLGLAAVAAMALMAFAGSASATTFSIKGVTQTGSVSLTSTLTSGSTAVLKDESGTTTDTCNVSEVKGSTVSPFTGTTIGGPVSSLTFTGCSHTTKVLKNGSLKIERTGVNTGSVTSSEAEVTVVSTVFGISAVCKTGAGTKIGTFTGTNESTKHATIAIDATNTLDCGILGKSSWTGNYTVTSPTGLNVVS
jgi:large repetitive protein